ncbi:MAG: hypothetical protein ACLRMZ_04115 [Blautia marasmi]
MRKRRIRQHKKISQGKPQERTEVQQGKPQERTEVQQGKPKERMEVQQGKPKERMEVQQGNPRRGRKCPRRSQRRERKCSRGAQGEDGSAPGEDEDTAVPEEEKSEEEIRQDTQSATAEKLMDDMEMEQMQDAINELLGEESFSLEDALHKILSGEIILKRIFHDPYQKFSLQKPGR